MSRARALSLGVFLVFAAAAVAAYLLLRPTMLGVAGFLLIGLAGLVVSGRLWDRLAGLEEKRRDMDDRKNSIE